MQIQTVGDQIFALNKEVKMLRKRCNRYEQVLRKILEQPVNQLATGPASNLPSRHALPDLQLDPMSK